MERDSLKHKTAQGLFWGGISNGFQQLLSLFFGIYFARLLSADDYGLIGMLAIFSGIAGTIINSGFFIALVNKKDAKYEDYNAVFWFTFFTGLICYSILFLLAPLIATFYDHSELKSLSRVVFISFFFSGIGVVPSAILYKELRVKTKAKIDILTLLIAGSIGVFLAIKGFSYWALATQSLIFIIGNALLTFFVVRWTPSFPIIFTPLKEMLPFSMKLLFTNIFQQINNNIFSVLLGRFYTAAETGYYTQGYKWMWMTRSVISGMIVNVAQPVLINVKEDKERELKIFRKIIRFTAFVSFPSLLGFGLVSSDFIQLTIGDKWLPCVPILQMLCVWASIDTFISLFQQLFFIRGRSDIYLWTNILLGVLQITVVIAMLNWGIYWMVLGSIFVYIGYFFIVFFCASKLIQFSLLDLLKDLTPYLLITVFTLVLSYFFTKEISNICLRFISRISIAIIIYIITMKLTNSTIFNEGVDFLFKRKNNL
ncbi:lipopolysaccharide biosynthesis protein [Parabacteroides bouchesdurhonensis]|uniref:lipopolysaccharide biosynthesis protein n=1 Tax=Parabacteroides bouchesdurhonensis TaxID=1936995 RepID=UPI000C8307F3|nr:lipopolysaccharide biosynthesis protein [Parabacteroides bouchesdurhonensis]